MSASFLILAVLCHRQYPKVVVSGSVENLHSLDLLIGHTQAQLLYTRFDGIPSLALGQRFSYIDNFEKSYSDSARE